MIPLFKYVYCYFPFVVNRNSLFPYHFWGFVYDIHHIPQFIRSELVYWYRYDAIIYFLIAYLNEYDTLSP